MELIYPKYYYDFRCLAADCPDSCCKEWAVDVDDVTAGFYRSLPGELGQELRAVLHEEDGSTVMTITNGRCPMWQQDGLCRIQAELGHDALCQVCRDFPRIRHDYGSFTELGLELSCPEAARLIFTASEHRMVISCVSGGEIPDYDPVIMCILRKSREEILNFLDDGQYPLAETLAIVLLYGYGVQGQIDGGEEAVFSPENALRSAKSVAAPANWESLFVFFRELEILTSQWGKLLSTVPTFYGVLEGVRPLARYGIQRYWLQAISDGDLIGRIKFILAACLLVSAIGGEPAQTAQLFSKEIENDPDNVNRILDAAYTEPAFADTHLLGLLFGR